MATKSERTRYPNITKETRTDGTVVYCLRYRMPGGKDTRHRESSLRALLAWQANNTVKKQRGEFVAESVGKTTVGELGPAWLERRRAYVKPTTLEHYEAVWRCHVEPHWSNVRIANIHRPDISAWLASLKLSPSRAQSAHTVLLGILEDAVDNRLLAANPARGAKLPKAQRKQGSFLTWEQLCRFADECDHYGYKSLVLMMGTAGLRWGEAMALRPCDIDWDRGRINVTRNAVRLKDGRSVIGTPKSGHSRIVPVPAPVLEELARTVAAKGRSREDLIWQAPWKGGYMRTPSADSSWFVVAVRRCQAADETFPRITPQSLRRTACTIANSVGAPSKLVQQLAGHASLATTDRYVGVYDADMDTVAAKVSKLWPRVV